MGTALMNQPTVTPLLQLLNKTEKAVYTASRNSLRVRDYVGNAMSERVYFPDLKKPEWRELSGEDLARYKMLATLMLIYEVIGLKREQFPSKALNRELTKFIVRKYPDLTPENVYDAFSMAIADEYPGATVSLKHYGNISLMYVQDVLKVYRAFQLKTLEEAERKINNASRDVWAEAREINVKCDAATKYIILSVYKTVLEGNINTGYLLPEHYDFLNDCGLIDLTTPEKLALLEKAKTHREEIEKAAARAFKRAEYHNAIKPVMDDMGRAKTLTVVEQMERWKACGFSIDDLETAMGRACSYNPKNLSGLNFAGNKP